MGTRNLTGVIKNGEYRVAQYGQWDGYPEGQGATVYDFLMGEGNIARLEANLDNCRWVTEEDYAEARKEIGVEDTNGWLDPEQAQMWQDQYPTLDRGTCATILFLVAQADGNPVVLKNDEDFLNDGLFCEWAYVIDLDTRELKVYADGTTVVATFQIDAMPTTEDEFFLACYTGKKKATRKAKQSA